MTSILSGLYPKTPDSVRSHSKSSLYKRQMPRRKEDDATYQNSKYSFHDNCHLLLQI